MPITEQNYIEICNELAQANSIFAAIAATISRQNSLLARFSGSYPD
jgi:hypothetical protein